MIISMIAAMGQSREIGKENSLLWKLPNDMRWFVKNTKNKTIVMGRKTFESFGAKPLPNRKNIVVTTDQNYQADGATVVHSIEAAIEAGNGSEELMVIGGANFYEQLLPRAERLYLTYVESEFDADAYFPWFEENDWTESFSEEHEADSDHAYAYRFVILERKRH